MKKIFTLMAIASTLLFAWSCDKDDDDNGGKKEKEEKQENKQPVTIDGDFADWAALNPTAYVSAKNNPNSPWEGVKEIRCFADENFVYYYIKFNSETLKDAFDADTPAMHIRLCINTDGEYTTGYQNYFLQGYDFIIEGSIVEEGAFVDFDGTLHQRYNDKWNELLLPGANLVMGKGAGTEYEILLTRQVFNNAAAGSEVPMPMGNTIQTGIRFYWNGWDEFSNMPNSSIDDVENGWGNLLEVTVAK